MDHIISDASALDAEWQKASASGGNGDCVEFAPVGDGVAVRHSKAPQGPALLFTRSEIAAMLDGARAGEFDHLAGQA
ncbi:DUF397 domain-containing protein [Streptomyces lunaelactis]|uniref:DUF397 domain-containing protein n=1 Tax=Streptomyces lunaelactis TaxID=1535768 RepID=UPI001584B64B|nr:DUF397 domain-containing protein [Streptomyces lunaelactis]NUK01731.1 DUF397 domain-containing protein [Streptomyces lunaelactis]NUK34574.1 DUF397 domain-containing protein [Streptomyces lunaelactis]NUK42223.1 DUF397 domain-containing protein [Streptomyces lunaelactis]NUK91654.1 DUF397 domain-containing protein [Streptomyces lunaelactis]NUL31116.1 DUF397 domain-containing protein [Streptomyces lunaelactis]